MISKVTITLSLALNLALSAALYYFSFVSSNVNEYAENEPITDVRPSAVSEGFQTIGTYQDSSKATLLEKQNIRDGSNANIEESLASVLSDKHWEETMGWIASSSPFSKGQLQTLRDRRGFLKRFMGIINGDYEKTARLEQVSFLASYRKNGVDNESSKYSFSASQNSIYASFSTNDKLTQPYVLVKWTNVDTGNVLTFDRYKINQENHIQHVWFRPNSDWSPGLYKVEIFSSDIKLTPLAAGEYHIFNK